MRILVTGGAGFIGTHLVQNLLSLPSHGPDPHVEHVITLDKLTYAGNLSGLGAALENPRHTFVRGDVGDRIQVASLLRDYQINAVMHLASESHVDRSIADPEDFVMTNCVGTYRMLEEFRRYRLDSSAACVFLHVSTDEVFGALGMNDMPFDENSAHAPNSPYSASKAAADHMVRAYHHTYGLPVLTTHCSNNYGPCQHSEKLIPQMIYRALRGEPLPVYGDGMQIRDWIHVADHCRALIKVLFQGVMGQSYVIGGRCEVRNIDLVKRILALIHELAPNRLTISADRQIIHVADRPGHDFRYALDPSRMNRELGWQPEIAFDEGLRDTVKWYLDHQDRLKI